MEKMARIDIAVHDLSGDVRMSNWKAAEVWEMLALISLCSCQLIVVAASYRNNGSYCNGSYFQIKSSPLGIQL